MCLAIPGRITALDGDDPLLRSGRVDFGGVSKQISLAFVPEAKVGEYVLVHVGFAISRVSESEAQRLFEYLDEIDKLEATAEPAS